MKKTKNNILPILNLVLLIVVILYLLYQFYDKGSINTDGWFTLLMIVGVNLTQFYYWKEHFTRD
jgi:uncharacterized membrane protein YobD (UPF0266 family)